jgi:S1-C subfamily serine protease
MLNAQIKYLNPVVRIFFLILFLVGTGLSGCQKSPIIHRPEIQKHRSPTKDELIARNEPINWESSDVFMGSEGKDLESISRSLVDVRIISSDKTLNLKGLLFDYKRGLIATTGGNLANITDINVFLHDSRKFNAELIGHEHYTSLTILRIIPINLGKQTELPQVALKAGRIARLGSHGISSRNNENTHILHVDCSVNQISCNNAYQRFYVSEISRYPSDYGSPIYNSDWELLGIMTMRSRTVKGQSGDGYFVGVPIDEIKYIANQFITNNGLINTYYSGISTVNLTQELIEQFGLPNGGAVIAEIPEDSIFRETEAKVGNIVLEVNGIKVKSSVHFIRLLHAEYPSNILKIKILRLNKKKLREISIKVERRKMI